MANKRNSAFHISWTTISYRSVATAITVVLLVAVGGWFFMFPNSAPLQSGLELINKGLDKLGLFAHHSGSVGPQQAHFTNLDGTVRVKKANGNSWVAADFNLPLDRGDVIQTSSEGMAKVFFSDGTSYTVKPDSLIVIEENSANAQQQTQVAVQVTTGTVDLSTGMYAQGSSSQVIVAGATASFAAESSAMVHNDPRGDKQILVKKGSGQVTRNNETIKLAEYERVKFNDTSAQMERSKEVGPPTLISPSPMMPVYIAANGKPIDFSWAPASNSHGYRLRISRNPYFSSTVFDKIVQTTDLKVTGLKEGTYYWVVSSQDANGHESVESERYQFNLVLRAVDATALSLDLEPFVQHGRIIEVKGRTDPSARVMVNGQEVPMIRADGSFTLFTPPLPAGENLITVTAQTPKGSVKTHQKKVVLE